MTPIPSSPVQSQRGTDERGRLLETIQDPQTYLDIDDFDDWKKFGVPIIDMLRADAEQLRALEQRLEAYKLLDSGSLYEKACAWEMVAATLSEVVPDWHSLSDNGTDAACLAIRQLRARDEEIAGLRAALRFNHQT